MMRLARLVALGAVLCIFAPAASGDAEMTAEWIYDGTKTNLLRTKFGFYGYRPNQSVRLEKDDLRFWLPAREGTKQAGAYSLFALAGDCEVIITYNLLKLQTPTTGYGSGIGLTFDIEEGGKEGTGSIQRLDKPGKEGSKYLFQIKLPSQPEVYDLIDTKSSQGRIGLRRVKKELVFLVADTPSGDLEEKARRPFTDRSVRKVRIHADPGDSPTALDVKVWRIDVHSQEMTGGVAEIQPAAPKRWWVWLIVGSGVAGGGYWYWRRRRLAKQDL